MCLGILFAILVFCNELRRKRVLSHADVKFVWLVLSCTGNMANIIKGHNTAQHKKYGDRGAILRLVGSILMTRYLGWEHKTLFLTINYL